MDLRNVEQQVHDMVVPLVKTAAAVTPDAHLVSELGLDSLSLINLLLSLEAQLGIKLGPADMAFDDFHSCATLAKKLHQKTQAEGPGNDEHTNQPGSK